MPELLLAGGAVTPLCDGARVDGDLRAGRQMFEQAYRTGERKGDAEAMAVAVLGLAGPWVHEQRGAAATTQMQARLRHVLALVPAGSALALRLRARLAGETDYCAGEYAAILAVVEEARRSADPVARVEALSIAHQCLLGPDHGPLRRALATELIGESSRTGRRGDLVTGLLWDTVDLFLGAEPHAERRLGELRQVLAQADHPAVSFVVEAIGVMLAIRADRLDDAEALAQACAQRGLAAGHADAIGWYGAQLFAIRWYQGRLPELVAMLDELVHSPTLSPVDNSYFAALAVAAATAGDRRKATGALARLVGRDLADLPRSSSWLVTMYGAVEVAHLLADADTAVRAYELLSPYAHLPVVASLGVACFGSVHHALGVASLTIGDADRAVEHFGEAIQRNLAIGHWPAVTMSRQRHAQALALRAQPRNAVAAQATHAPTIAWPDIDRQKPSRPRSSSPRRSGPRRHDHLQVRLLGPVDATVNGVVRSVNGLRRKTVLAVLALRRGEIVSTDLLVDAVWGEAPPLTATNTLQSHVSHLRRVLESKVAILAHSPGYVLDLGDDATDVDLAQRLIRQGNQSADHRDRVRHLQAALALWRGRSLADVAESGWLSEQAGRLNRLWLETNRALIGTRLVLGEHAQLVPDLESLSFEHPFDEQIHRQLMLALYRTGRQADALASYRRLRRTLADDLGIGPSQALRDLEAAILRQDPELDVTPPIGLATSAR